jgi:hypothetical protein
MKVINNCNMLLDSMVEITVMEYDTIEFEGTTCSIVKKKFFPRFYRNCQYFFYNNKVYLVSALSLSGNYFILSIMDNWEYDDNKEMVCVLLPKEVREELIATLRGEW